MKKVLWLIPPREQWLSKQLAPRLATKLGLEGFSLHAPIIQRNISLPERIGHCWRQLKRVQPDIVHAFDTFSAWTAICMMRGCKSVVFDAGIDRKTRGGWRSPKVRHVGWGKGENLTWPIHPRAGSAHVEMGDMIGFDCGEYAPSLGESVVWAFEIARQVTPNMRLVLGEGIEKNNLWRFSKSVGADNGIATISSGEAFDSGRLKGLILAHPDRRTIELSAQAVAAGLWVAWLTGMPDEAVPWPANDREIHWRDRPGLARKFLNWQRHAPFPQEPMLETPDNHDLLVSELVTVYREVEN
ncbi:MAG: hypothetical protein KJS91_14665 [Planctomycetes bacterium]|nr:hypothetical protein [Planctomycetota bacterium]